MEYILEITNLTKKYKKTNALNNLNMHIEKGSIYGFVGKNGAGKTTTMRILCGLQNPTSGEFSIYGVKNKDSKIANSRKRIGAVIESPAIYGEMTAEENLKNQYRILGMPSFRGIKELLKLVDLDKTGNKKAKEFSLGMRQRLGIAIALAGSPDFLILDEPINGLDPQGIIEIRELILRLNKEKNITILISSHILEELSKLATHYGFIDKGRIIQEITAKELEEKCQKGYELEVDDVQKVVCYLEEKNISYSVNEKIVKVYSIDKISDLILNLAKIGCDVINIHDTSETVEGYFLNLVGGE